MMERETLKVMVVRVVEREVEGQSWEQMYTNEAFREVEARQPGTKQYGYAKRTKTETTTTTLLEQNVDVNQSALGEIVAQHVAETIRMLIPDDRPRIVQLPANATFAPCPHDPLATRTSICPNGCDSRG